MSIRHALAVALLLSSAAPARANEAGEPRAKVAARPVLRSPYSRKPQAALGSGPLVTLAGTGHVTEGQYRDLSNALQTLLKRYPASSHYFIGTGRDPAPLIAGLENLGGRALAMNFPASNIVNNANITPELLDAYFKRLIPDEHMRADILSGRRTLVLLDQSNTGKTPSSLAPYFQRYFDQIGSPAKMVKVAVAPQPHTVQQGVDHVLTWRFNDVSRYLGHPYEGVVSEFPRHVLGQDNIEALVQRQEYVQYKAAVLDRMKQDKALHEFLVLHADAAAEDEPDAAYERRLAADERRALETGAPERRILDRKTSQGNGVYLELERQGAGTDPLDGTRSARFQAKLTFKDWTGFNGQHRGMAANLIVHTLDEKGQVGRQVFENLELPQMLDGTFHYAQDLHVLGDGGNVTAIEVAFRNFSGRPRETWMRGRRHYQVVGNDWDAEGGGNHKLEGFHP